MKTVTIVVMQKSALYLVSVFLVWLIVCSKSLAHDLGVIGKTYDIAEQNLIEFMKSKMQAAIDNGEIDAAHKSMKSSTEDFIDSPPGTHLPAATKYKFHRYDPTFVLDHDIKDAYGKLLHPIGTTINPLDHVNLNRAMCFVDGNDELQLKWVLEYCSDPLESKMVLVNGPLGKLMKEHPDKRFFFDQQSILVKKLGITAVPSVVRQSGRVLVVEEFPLEQ